MQSVCGAEANIHARNGREVLTGVACTTTVRHFQSPLYSTRIKIWPQRLPFSPFFSSTQCYGYFSDISLLQLSELRHSMRPASMAGAPAATKESSTCASSSFKICFYLSR